MKARATLAPRPTPASHSNPPENQDDGLRHQRIVSSSDPEICEDGDLHDDNNGGWLGDITSLARSARSTFDGVANILHRSAMTVAAEIAQLERDADWTSDAVENPLPFPWEIQTQELQRLEEGNEEHICLNQEDKLLKDQILRISMLERNFFEPFSPEDATETDTCQQDDALTDARIDLIRRLLEIDLNLAAMHARLSGRNGMKETVFWRNYFYHCDNTRRSYLEQTYFAEDASRASTIGSLIPAADNSTRSDDGSYICIKNSIASPPSSLNTLTETISIGDMVLVGSDGAEITDLDERHME